MPYTLQIALPELLAYRTGPARAAAAVARLGRAARARSAASDPRGEGAAGGGGERALSGGLRMYVSAKY